MEHSDVVVIVPGDVEPSDIEALKAADQSVSVTLKQHFNGFGDQLIIVAGLTALRFVLKFALDLAKLNRVSYVEVKGVKIVNPTDEQVAKLLDDHGDSLAIETHSDAPK